MKRLLERLLKPVIEPSAITWGLTTLNTLSRKLAHLAIIRLKLVRKAFSLANVGLPSPKSRKSQTVFSEAVLRSLMRGDSFICSKAFMQY
jgi:hypothetical protein